MKEVTLYATVRDKKGKIVSNLNKDDFTLDQDGAPQTISYFARESDVPLTIGPLVDTSMSTRHVLGAERDASYAFLNDMLRPDKDKGLPDPLRPRGRAAAGPDFVARQTESCRRAAGNFRARGCEGGGWRRPRLSSGGTLLYDAIFLASDELMQKQQGRKALIVFSDGVDRGSKKDLEDAVESAQRADTAVYSILFAGEEENTNAAGGFGHGGGGIGQWPLRISGRRISGGGGYPGGGGGGGGQRRNPQHEGADGKKVLQRISSETGGRFFEVSKKLTIDQIYAQIEEELRNQYSLGYTPHAGGLQQQLPQDPRHPEGQRPHRRRPRRVLLRAVSGMRAPAGLM